MYVSLSVCKQMTNVRLICLSYIAQLEVLSLAWFYGISTFVGYLMPNPLYTYTLNIYDLVWLSFMAYQQF